mmetsp:Transcript_2737/g.8611  ORF Transcript_2737/g.8611 Transcript_2737/m.8611 type:complete len:183 (+) Transcript_2737:17-565(+)
MRALLAVATSLAACVAACRVCERSTPRFGLPPLSPAVRRGPPARMPSRRAARSVQGGGEEELVAAAVAALLTVLIDAGRRPVDTETEAELASFADEESSTLAESAAFVLLRGYKRAISPNLPKNCRFVPTCSEYAALAIKEFGLGRGAILTAWRLARCNPAGGAGYDPPVWPPPRFDVGRST